MKNYLSLFFIFCLLFSNFAFADNIEDLIKNLEGKSMAEKETLYYTTIKVYLEMGFSGKEALEQTALDFNVKPVSIYNLLRMRYSLGLKGFIPGAGSGSFIKDFLRRNNLKVSDLKDKLDLDQYETLIKLQENDFVIKKTAESMGLHINTVGNRLYKITQIINKLEPKSSSLPKPATTLEPTTSKGSYIIIEDSYPGFIKEKTIRSEGVFGRIIRQFRESPYKK